LSASACLHYIQVSMHAISCRSWRNQFRTVMGEPRAHVGVSPWRCTNDVTRRELRIPSSSSHQTCQAPIRITTFLPRFCQLLPPHLHLLALMARASHPILLSGHGADGVRAARKRSGSEAGMTTRGASSTKTAKTSSSKPNSKAAPAEKSTTTTKPASSKKPASTAAKGGKRGAKVCLSFYCLSEVLEY
jgi:hypothetical protein